MKSKDVIASKLSSGPRPRLFARLWRGESHTALVTYSGAPAHEARDDEKRREDRRRTRLRAGKILDRANRFLADATIIDRSSWGVRLLASFERPIYIGLVARPMPSQTMVEALDCGADDVLQLPCPPTNSTPGCARPNASARCS